MEHEIATVQVLHHEEKVGLEQKFGISIKKETRMNSTHVSLEGAKEVAEEGVFDTQGENFSLDHRTLNVIVLQNRIFLQCLVINQSGDESQVP